MNKFRKAMVLEMMKELDENGLIEALLEMEFEKSKEQFFKKLTPKDEQAFRVVFMAILEKHDSLRDNENKEILNNWGKHFIEYHDEKILSMKENLQETMYSVIEELGDEFVSEFFTIENRTLEQLIDATGKCYKRAIDHIQKAENALHKKLHDQLNEVAETLKELTKGDKGVKQFEIEIENANFEIILND